MIASSGFGRRLKRLLRGKPDRAAHVPCSAAAVLAGGPARRWGDVAPEGGLLFDAAGPAVSAPHSGAFTGPSPRLRCGFPGGDGGASIDIVIEAGARRGRRYYRVCLGSARTADLAALGIALPSGEAHLWAVTRNAEQKLVTAGRTDLRVEPALPNSAERIAIVNPPPADIDTASPAVSGDDQGQLHLAIWARDVDAASGTAADPRFVFGPLRRTVDVLLVPAEVPGVFPNAFTAAWFATLLSEREAGAIRVERGEGAQNRAMTEALGSFFPPQTMDFRQPGWTVLAPAPELADRIGSLPTSYPGLHRAYDGFRERLAEHGWAEIAGRSFMYSMLGASRNSLLLERLAARIGCGSPPSLVDIGGGFGFLGLELAAKGWPVAVIDYDPFKTEVMGRWLADRVRPAGSIEFRTQSMDEIPETGLPADRPRLVTFFHSLRLARRDLVPAILRRCWDSLAPGGALVIHELVHGTPGESAEDELLFRYDDLLRVVSENAAKPGYWSVLDAAPMAEFVAGTSLFVACR